MTNPPSFYFRKEAKPSFSGIFPHSGPGAPVIMSSTPAINDAIGVVIIEADNVAAFVEVKSRLRSK